MTLPPARVVSPESSGSLRPVSPPEVVLDPARTMRRAHRRKRPVRVEEPAVVNVPILMLQDPLVAVGAVVLDCRPSLLPVSMDISGVDMSAVRLPAMSAAMDGLLPGREQLSTGGGGGGGDLLGLICPELGVTPLVDPGTDLEDERPTPVGSPVAAIDEGMPLSPTLGADVEVARALLEMGVDVGRGLASAGGGCSCWPGGRESSSERDAIAPGFLPCLGGFPGTAPVFVGVASHARCRSAI